MNCALVFLLGLCSSLVCAENANKDNWRSARRQTKEFSDELTETSFRQYSTEEHGSGRRDEPTDRSRHHPDHRSSDVDREGGKRDDRWRENSQPKDRGYGVYETGREGDQRNDRRWENSQPKDRGYGVYEPGREGRDRDEVKQVVININHDCADPNRTGRFVHKITVRPKSEGHAVLTEGHLSPPHRHQQQNSNSNLPPRHQHFPPQPNSAAGFPPQPNSAYGGPQQFPPQPQSNVPPRHSSTHQHAPIYY